MPTSIRAITRIQDADDAPVLGASTDGHALLWDNATDAFVVRDAAAVRDGSPVGAFSSMVTGYQPTVTIGGASGWAYPVGVRQNFRYVVIPFLATTAERFPRTAYVAIRENNSTGALLAATVAGVSCSDTVSQYAIVADFGESIVNAGGVPLWVGFETDGLVTLFWAALNTYPVASGYPQVAYSQFGLPITPAWATLSGTQYAFWTEFYRSSDEIIYAIHSVNGHAVAGLIGPGMTITPGLIAHTMLGNTNTTGASSAASSTFSGWGQYAGNVSAFNAVKFRFFPFNPANMPTTVIVRVRRMPLDAGTWNTGTPATWEIIAQSQAIRLEYISPNAWVPVVAALDRTAAGQCWVEVATDGYIGLDANGGPNYAINGSYVTGKSLVSTLTQNRSGAANYTMFLGMAAGSALGSLALDHAGWRGVCALAGGAALAALAVRLWPRPQRAAVLAAR